MSSTSLSQVLSSSMVFIFSPFLCKELTISLFSTMLLSIKLSIIWTSFLVYKCRFSLFVLTGQNFSICAGITTNSSVAANYISSSLFLLIIVVFQISERRWPNLRYFCIKLFASFDILLISKRQMFLSCSLKNIRDFLLRFSVYGCFRHIEVVYSYRGYLFH